MGLNPYVIDFSDLHRVDSDLIGKKANKLSELKYLGILIPDGFVITSLFFDEFLRKTSIGTEIRDIKDSTHPALYDSLPKLYEPMKKKIMQTSVPQDLIRILHETYRKLSGELRHIPLNIYSFTKNGKSKIFENVKGDANLIVIIKDILISFLDESITIIVQKSLQSKIKGKIFTNDNLIDEKLIHTAKKIQKHFYFPQEVDYVIEKGKVYITDIKPFTGTVNESPKSMIQNKTRKILVKGISINPGIATGKVKILHNYHNNIEVKKGEIIVLPNLFPSIFKKMKNAKAIVADSIAPNSLNKALYRKNFKIPTIEGAKNAAKIFQNGNVVTVNGMSGEIYSGGLMS